jgi:hypothetical protein
VNAEQMKALREPFPESEIGKLPRVTCKACSDSQGRVCQQHNKAKCQVCGNYLTNAHIHLDFVGHAETTDRLLDVDPEWSWEPIAWTDDGSPATIRQGNNLVMWARLTLCGVTRLGVGTAPANKDDAHKELIGDFLRNAAMRFGVALDLWRKSERAEAEHHAEEPAEAPAPKPAAKKAKASVPAEAAELHTGDKDWREEARQRNVTPGVLVKQARAFADELRIDPPPDIDHIPAVLTEDLLAWLEQKGKAA